MDPALLREREAFLKRARSQPTVEKRKAKPSADDHVAKKAKVNKPAQPKVPKPLDYKTSQGTSQYRFSVLARIVKHMKIRHQEGDTEPLLLDEVLDETNQTDVTTSIRHWLATEALTNNPKIAMKGSGEDRKFAFKPTLDIRDKKGLMRLLKNYDLVGKGGVLMEDVGESLPNAERAIKNLREHLVEVIRPADKKKVLFYKDKAVTFEVEDEYKKMWRSVGVEGLDEAKIEEYLTRSGISSMQDAGVRRVSAVPKRKGGGKKNSRFKRHNEHVSDVLKDYSELTNKK